MCRESMTAGADSEKFMSTWLANRARPSMLFKNVERTLPAEQAMAVKKERMKFTVKAGEPFVVWQRLGRDHAGAIGG